MPVTLGCRSAPIVRCRKNSDGGNSGSKKCILICGGVNVVVQHSACGGRLDSVVSLSHYVVTFAGIRLPSP
jgi:hypothetical protein